jgi:Ca2+-binding EF-hand superfamily protein
MRTSLSKAEFASALGMKPDAVFVRMMFNIVDKDSDGRISFQVRAFFNIKYKFLNMLYQY